MIADVLPPEDIAAFLDRRRAEDAAAGLPEHVEDPDVLARIARIVTDNRRIATNTTTNTQND